MSPDDGVAKNILMCVTRPCKSKDPIADVEIVITKLNEGGEFAPRHVWLGEVSSTTVAYMANASASYHLNYVSRHYLLY